MEEKDRYENTEPETEDVEGHRFKDDPERKELGEADRMARSGDDDFEAHRQQADRQQADRQQADRQQADRQQADRQQADRQQADQANL